MYSLTRVNLHGSLNPSIECRVCSHYVASSSYVKHAFATEDFVYKDYNVKIREVGPTLRLFYAD